MPNLLKLLICKLSSLLRIESRSRVTGEAVSARRWCSVVFCCLMRSYCTFCERAMHENDASVCFENCNGEEDLNLTRECPLKQCFCGVYLVGGGALGNGCTGGGAFR